MTGAVAGLLAGAVVASVWAIQLPTAGLAIDPAALSGSGLLVWLLVAAIPGALIALLGMHDRERATPSLTVARGLLVGILWWAAWPLTLAPLFLGRAPTWSGPAIDAASAALVANLLQGALVGVLCSLFINRHPPGPQQPSVARRLPRILVLGGGFAGVAAVQRLDSAGRRDRRNDVTLVSASNYLLFTPMLPEVAAGGIHPEHVSAPIRAACPRTRFVHGHVRSIDLARRLVSVGSGERTIELAYDQLVLALGSEPTYHDLPGLRSHSLPLKTLADAESIRAHVLSCLEEADFDPDASGRPSQLTFCVVGGGFAGVEAIAELRDFVHSVIRYFPSLDRTDARFVLVHSHDRILPELSAALGTFAAKKVSERGIELLLSRRVAAARADALVLRGGDEISTRTIVWTAGNRASRALAPLALEKGRDGAIRVESTLRSSTAGNVWAAGDCAAVPDGSGGLHPPTAQHAIREGRHLADNLVAVLDGRAPVPFQFRTVGMLAAIGSRSGVAEFRGWRFSGALAWALWRMVYLSKLPGLEKRARVAIDWWLDLWFPREIVLTREPPSVLDTGTPDAGGAAAGRSGPP